MKKIAFVALTVLLLAACQPGRNADNSGEVELEPEVEVEQAPQQVRRRYQPRERPSEETAPLPTQDQLVPDFLEGRLEQSGHGLALMIDASSMDAFHQSLELIASETSHEQYAGLDAAIRMLEVYDLEASASPNGLLSTLDGMTGEEIIERAHSMRSRR